MIKRKRRVFKVVVILCFYHCLFLCSVQGQSFAPPPGFPGSTAIHKDSSIIINWANGAELYRGYLNIQNTALGLVTHGSLSDALGPADGTEVVSLGDSGSIVFTFPSPIVNGPGPDFAVFENGFTDNYMELAFVEVSSDGTNYFRFDAVSETPSSVQLTNFSVSDCRYINNLAGKFRANYGTPFDLEEMEQSPGLDVNNVTHIKLVDVVGSIDHSIGSFDSENNIINDPYPTEFVSGGFDVDAVGVIHQGLANLELNMLDKEFDVFPNPSQGRFECRVRGAGRFVLFDFKGSCLKQGEFFNDFGIDISNLDNGIYYLKVYNAHQRGKFKLVKI